MSKRRSADETGKYCPDCKERRPLEEFYKVFSRFDGLSSYCKKHQLQRDRAYRKTPHFQIYMRDYMQQKRDEPKPIRAERVLAEEGLKPKPRKPNAFDREAMRARLMEQARKTLIEAGFIPANAGD